ncbi:MAG: MSMEG_0565 family glycosyltransferase [Elainellaceae cyanobacterium]
MPLRIALLTYSTKPRGSVIHTLELSTALTALGHQVCIYALDKGTGFERSLPCQVRLVPARPAPVDIDGLIRQRIGEFVAALRPNTGQYDIYHAQDCIGANALGALGCAPVVRTVHHVEAFESIYLQQCQDRSIREPDRCLVVSDRWRQALLQDYGIEAVRVVNGVDRQRFTPRCSGEEAALRDRYGLTGPVFLTVGGIEPRKNSIRLLQAFAQVRRHCPTAQLMIVGGATLFDYQAYRDRFFDLAAALGLREALIPLEAPAPLKALILPGVVPDAVLPALYRCADAFVFPSLKEGWGLVLLEAIASGLPIVASDQPPFTEFLSPQQACLVNPHDAEVLAAAMLRALNPQVAEKLVHQSQSVLGRYTWGRSARQHVREYNQLCANRQQEGLISHARNSV